jgi:hypothetical protein
MCEDIQASTILIIHRCAQRRYIHVKEIGSMVHRRLGQEFAPMFRGMEGGDEDVIEETMWQPACLCGIPSKNCTLKAWAWLLASTIGNHNINTSAFASNM